MRLTSPLAFPIRWNRINDFSWHRWRKRGINRTILKGKLEAAGVKVEDALEVFKKDSPLFLDLDAIPNVQPVFPSPPKLDSTHPHWHKTPVKMFDDKTFTFEGVKQAQLLTNSVKVKAGLPDRVLELGNSNGIEYQDILVARIIKQAYLWECYLEKLPKLRDLDIPEFKFPLKYGTPQQKKNETMLRNMIRLCDSKSPQLATSRMLAGEEEFQVSFAKMDKSIQVKVSPMFTMLSKELLPHSAHPDESVNVPLPSIYPFLSYVGINEQNIYTDKDRLAFKKGSGFPYIHTTFFSHHIPGSHTHSHPRWTDERFSGTSVMYNFATALLMARRKYGEDISGALPAPITTQNVHITGQEFQFSVFQLNTMDLDESNLARLKNIIWLTPKMKLFDKCEYDPSGTEILQGYNPEVFKILLGFYHNDHSGRS